MQAWYGWRQRPALLAAVLLLSCICCGHGTLGGLPGWAAEEQQAASRRLAQQPHPKPYDNEGLGLPLLMTKPWSEVFPGQWKGYAQQLRRLQLPEQALESAQSLISNITQLNPTQMRRALAYQGGLHRLRRVVRDLHAGKAVKLAVLGGSISWGSAVDKGAADWFTLLLKRVKAAFPTASVSGRNGCVPATPSSFMNVCLERHLDADADLVFLEYATNDGWNISDGTKKRTYERLLRKVLSKPHAPAVVLLQLPTVGQAFDSRHSHKRGFADTVEDVYGAFAAYYDLPYLSMRNAIWRLGQFHHYQMNFSNWYGTSYDFIHPLDYGHAAIADMASWLLQQVVVDLGVSPWAEEDEAEVALPLMEPMYPGNYEEVNKLCLHGKEFASHVTASEGWRMVNEGNDIKPKWGFVTRKVGAQLRFEVNTTCSRASSPEHSSSSSHHAGDGVHTRRQHHSSDNSCTVIQLAYLRSYNKMGKAEVRCSGGCSCRPMLVDGHHSSRTSTIFLLRVQPSAGARCVVSVTVMSDTRSGGHKFKVTGVMASEVSNQDDWSGSEVKLNSEEWLGGVNRGDTEMRQRRWSSSKPQGSALTLVTQPTPQPATPQDRL